METRVITVSSTSGTRLRKIDSAASIWSELQSELTREYGYTLSNMKAIVGETQNNLEQEQASLPVTNFTLFLLPVKTKSGFISDVKKAAYKELREEIKSIKNTIDAAAFKKYFGNYTQSSTPELQKLVSSYYKKAGVTGTASTVAPVKTVAPKKPETSAPVKSKAVAAKPTPINEIAALKEEVAPVVAAKSEQTVSFQIPISMIPVGTYVQALDEAGIEELRRILK